MVFLLCMNFVIVGCFLSDHQNKQKNHDKQQLFLLLIKLPLMYVESPNYF